MTKILQDFFYAVRQLRKNRGLSAVTVLTFALGIGVNAAVFTLTYVVVLEHLPVPNPTQLVRYTFRSGSQDLGLSVPLYDALRKRSSTSTGLLAWDQSTFAVQENGGVKAVKGALMSGNGFRVLELRPVLGSTFSEADDAIGGGPDGYQGLLSYDYWQNHFQGASSVLGQVLTVNGKQITIIGVLPKGFDGIIAAQHTNLLLPLHFEAVLDAPTPMLDNAGSFWLTIMGRLKPGETLRHADAELQATQAAIREEADRKHLFMNGFFASFKLGVESGSSGRSMLRMAYQSPLMVLEILAGLLLLLCCTNVALLMLARISGRYQELAVRLALGATRGRIFRLILSEGVVLAMVGLGAGALVGWWAAKSLAAMIGSFGEAPTIDVTPRAVILAFTAGVSVFSALLATAFPAIHAGRADPQPQLKQTRASTALKHLGRWFVPAQVAVAIVLLACASLLMGTLRNLIVQGSGFRGDGLTIAETDLAVEKPTRAVSSAQARQILEKVAAAPGVQSATLLSSPPLHGWWSSGHYFSIDGHGSVHVDMETWPEVVSPNYFATMGTVIEQGRGFLPQDWNSGSQVCVLSASAARHFFPDENSLGKMIYAGGGNPDLDGKTKIDPGDTCQVIGVAGDAHFQTLRETPKRTLYKLFPKDLPETSFSLAVRSSNLAAAASAIRNAVHETAPSVIEPTPIAFAELVNEDLKKERMLTVLSTSCAAIALLLTALGLYALLARLVALRTREIGIRMALGSRPDGVLAMVIRDGMKLVLAGVVAGLFPALLAPRVMRSLLVSAASDSLIFVATVVVLVLVAAVACYIPARRAAKVDPMVALRYE
jgi:putative ABC transport system permease protein